MDERDIKQAGVAASPPEGELSGVVRPEIDYATFKFEKALEGAASIERTVTLKKSRVDPTPDQSLWVAIRNRSQAISFPRYNKFINSVFCEGHVSHGGTCQGENDERRLGTPPLGVRKSELEKRPSIYGVDAYNILRLATEIFLILEAGVVKVKDGNQPAVTLLDPSLFDPGEEGIRLGEPVSLELVEEKLSSYFGGTSKLPYLTRILNELLGSDPAEREERLPYCDRVLKNRFSCPTLIELIWSYWNEEGMLVQTMQSLALRFQNRRGMAERDPLANLEIDPLRPLNNLLWGYIQNEYSRLTVPRRAYEYDHHYGLTLYGKAVPKLRSADSRSKFLEAFHNLLHRASVFFREDADTTVIADGFPLLNALREVHLLLAEGAHNQFGDLPWTARVEMLIEQWLLARPEMRDFLRGRAMVPYQEDWMGQVDSMKKLQGWTDATVTHFHELAVFGEQVMLSVRYGDWIDSANTEDQAKNWARYWKNEIQRYIHSYRAVTGVDLVSEPVDSKPPWMHLRDRLEAQQRSAGRA